MLRCGDAGRLGRHADALALIDHEFVQSRGRPPSMAERLPAAFGPGNADGIFCLEEDGAVVSALASQEFHWRGEGGSIRGHMIGGVVTRADARGRQLGSQLLLRAEEELRGRGSEVLVLWTGIPEFYVRMGWEPAERGAFGPISLGGSNPPTLRVQRCESDAELERVHAFRAGVYDRCVVPPLAGPARFRNAPLPADHTETWASLAGEDVAGYVAFGVAGRTCYVYEQAGSPEAWHAQLHAIGRRFENVFVNEAGDPYALEQYATHGSPEFGPGPHCLAKPLRPDIPGSLWKGISIPYLDRI